MLSLALAALLPFVPIYWTALLGMIATAAMAYVSWLAFTKHGVLIDPLPPSLSAGFVFLAGVGQLYGQKRQQVSEIRSAFGRYVSPAVVARLAEHPEQLQLGGQERELTLMFCDIRSFTTLSEGFTAVELSTFLNEYLSPLTDIILKEEGTVDKYMGDAIMAFWNAPLDDPAHGIHAVRAALEMRSTLVRLNVGWKERAEKAGRSFNPVKFGIGLNTGKCSVGNMGSTQRFDYSALGDEVNIASRLEGSSKQFGVDIVASAATRDEAPEFAWLEIDHVKLKNKTRSVALFALAGDQAYCAERRVPASSGSARRHSEGVPGAKFPRREADGGRRRADRPRRGRRAVQLLSEAFRRARRAGAARELGADDRARREIAAVPARKGVRTGIADRCRRGRSFRRRRRRCRARRRR